MPCTERRARLLLGRGRAVVVRAYPFTIRLKNHLGRLDCILKQCKKPLRDASAVNSTRWALYQTLKKMGLKVEVGTGGRKTGSFNIQTNSGAIQGISHCHCVLTQRADGYGYHIQPNQQKEEGDRRNGSR
jgi:hypothetical protein